MSVTSWFLVSSSGTRHRLPPEMIFVGREECELMLQSRSVDKQHAVLNYDPATDEHMVKDLGSLNGTFVNDLRIPDQTYITLKLADVIRFGYDSHVYILERSQHKVPEEALKHEKYTSQLQMSMKALEARKREKERQHAEERTRDSFRSKQEKAEGKAALAAVASEAPVSRPTPLYGQPSWWGEDDAEHCEGQQPDEDPAENTNESYRQEVNGSLSDSQARPIYSHHREPSYFEIPTKEFQQRELQEVPTKDTDPPAVPVLPPAPTPTPPVVQSHASFTIEFDECMPGKIKIKDHVTKFSFRQQRKLLNKEAVTAPTEVMSAESKVADWLDQSDVRLVQRWSRTEDIFSTNSDLPIYNKASTGHHHEDGTRGNSEDSVVNGKQVIQSKPPRPFTPPDSEDLLSSSPPETHSPPQSQGKEDPQQAFVIEFFDDNPRKKRSQTFTNNTVQPDSPALRNKLEKKLSPSSPTQQYTIPLKGPGSGGPQRAGSLRREKTEDRINTSFSSQSSSIQPRPFRSVGRRSKLAQDFTAEFLRESRQETRPSMNTTWERKTSPVSPTISPPPTEMAAVPNSHHTPPSPPQPPVPYLTQTSTVNQPVSLKAPLISLVNHTLEAARSLEAAQSLEAARILEVRSPRSLGNEEDDALSEAGTYTIETEVQDEEVVEARSKIDQVSGGSKWVSRWASLADSYTDSGPSGLFDIPSQIELSGGVGGRTGYQAMLSRNVKSVESEGQSSRTRRILPQAPLVEKNETPTPSILVHQDTYSTYDVREKSSRALCPQEGLHNLSVQDDLDPDSLSDASKSDDGSIVDQRTTPTPDMTDKSSSPSREEERPRLTPKSTSFYIDSEERGSRPNTPRTERKLPPPPNTPQFSTATLTKQRGGQDSQKTVKPNSSAPKLDYQGRVSPQPKEISVSLVRQESFTKDQPGDAAQVTRLPYISSQPAQNDPDPAGVFQGICSQDTHSYLKETEDALAALEAKLQAQTDVVPCPIDDTLSGESDMDSASTASQRSNQTTPKTRSKKPSITCGLQRERSSASSFTQEPSRQPSAHNRLSEKQRSQGEDSRDSKPEPGRRLGMRRSVSKHGSMDLSDDTQGSSLPYWPDTISSDQEGYRPTARKKYTTPLQKEESSKSSKVSQALSRSNSMYAPRPTRASMLRRARLGEASDNEGTETDRISQEASGTTKASQDSKKQLSRLDMLALPRKRTSSFTTPSDTESSAPRTGFSNRSTESNSGSGRKASVARPSSKPVLGRASGAPCKPITRGRSSSAKYTSSTASSRRRQKGSDYTSTSEEEYDSGNQITPKHKRSQTPSASRSQPLIPPRPKARSRDSDQESHEGDAYQNWSSHSAEIAKLSQDLAKDLAILAREIHDVAGDTDPQSSSGVEANTPASTMTTQDELVHPIPEAGVNYQRAPPGSPAAGDPDQTMMNEQEHNSKHRGWNQEEVVVDDLMLNPVSQISLAIRENTEQLAEKIKVLFHNKQDIWEEIEAKINAENDIPVLKGSNKEITSILKELRRVQRQLEVINTIIEPSGNLEPAKTSTPISPSSASVRPSRAPSRDWRSLGSQQGEGGVSSSSSRSSESVRRSAMASEAESYVV
ncbi:centrosomal protein of 170 kDa protein B isoform X2 [Oncorhynchus tshawytscha]|uniref:centrosomal protein of 170 kDa protein B isoform X2 n=1 Tax=Oncorhynchus tshawytscha TaxID=74940 RepID=UPI001C3E7FD8|nr:centrosomal protein of 170 kDa protein B isoform X2 [Oncorhynchus tshawytscha]